jgi:CDP-4-dehydro-6-deoxyglucose reductase
VFEEMSERAILPLRGPLGTFYLREDSDKPMIFVAGGTGFAPIKAQIEHSSTTAKTARWCSTGARVAAGPLHARPAAAVAGRAPELHVHPGALRPLPEDAWPGRTGLVHQAVLDDFADLSGYQVYACGAPA